ncbi:hypothetical protein GF326_01835 [Candidatus Bathyarchaeota archaeon]|nr:hypothetical protein [Candidatus Bathyarchaeota archaeon]
MTADRIARQVEISVLVHATEDRSKVLKAVRRLFPQEMDLPVYKEEKLDGYYGDPIRSFYFNIKNRRPATDIFNHILDSLSSLDYVTLLDELAPRMDDTKNFYLRFSKQKAYQGKVALETHDPIKVKVSLQVPHKADPVEVLREYMEERRG